MNTSTSHLRQNPPLKNWLIFGLLLVLPTAAGFLLETHMSLTSQAMIYVLAVVVAAYKLDRLASVVGAVGAVTALNFFFVPPRWTFGGRNSQSTRIIYDSTWHSCEPKSRATRLNQDIC